MRMFLILGFCLFNYFFSSLTFSADKILHPVQLAMKYHQNINIKDYLVSEKYDGIRAIWNGKTLKTRSGKHIYAPKWFIEKLPNIWLDGELWSRRGEFEFISSTVRRNEPNENWQYIKYMVFDVPDKKLSFSLRYEKYHKLINNLNLNHIKAVQQFKVESNENLTALLKDYVDKGAEGLMLHHQNATFQSGRSRNLIKLKPFMDAEATVIALLPGKGKFKGMLGSLLVKTTSGIEFKIGSGFTDFERKNPPKIGDIITFSYHGLTKNQIPKFASFMRIRH
ncbi:DNA ligase [Pseudoalteromonas denitrificans]|uniref:DNA ligase-1 n=1 Tax=Pseudoalteromonas denitrificans DSM 6059 TaxID=1123010 RepID=A0A1I1MJ23_9GAMM|nr:DNA ligase [Pseudoalteromonas denitrificans]SFC85514.1 DNA ligase-1 [Pseudoalteromonas denitrificans DSM 6059]